MNITDLNTALDGRYHLERELGQGGMATVYLAHDVKHDRRVAMKVLRPELAAVIGADRFLAEIKTTANLQHPHILSLFDSGTVQGTVFYVMPYVEGESLRDRLTREKQLPVPDALRIAREVADALEYAHQHGVIHRDIKPENIMLQGGHALVADFGIALAASNTGGSRMTETGMSLGTPHYMSPEQAMGERTLDARTDVYALGCVTYEMLIGEPPFTGPTAQAIVAKVMTEKPASIAARRDRVSPAVEDAVFAALEKLPADRIATAAEFATAISNPDTGVRTASRATTGTQRRGAGVMIAASGLIVILAAVAAWGWLRPRAVSLSEHAFISFGDSARLQISKLIGVSIAISPDGATTAIIGDTLGRIWLKRAAALEPQLLAGTEHATSPVFSPDGKWIAFIAGDLLRKIPLDGGPSTQIADSAAASFGVAWLDDNSIVFTAASLLGMRRIPADGGRATVVVPDSLFHGQGPMHATPIAGAEAVLFQLCASSCVTSSLHALDLKSGKEKLLVDNVLMGWYLPIGALVYLQRDGVLMAVPFDRSTLSLRGTAVPVVSGVLFNGKDPLVAVSRSGTLLYATGPGTGMFTVKHQTRTGMPVAYDPSWSGNFNSFAISADGRRAAVGVSSSKGATDIWIKELDRGPFTRLTNSGHDRRPAWSPDGRSVAFVRDSGGGGDIYVRAVEGGAADRVLVHLGIPLQEVAWSHDGKWIFVRTETATAGVGDILAVHANGDSGVIRVAATAASEIEPVPSPDGRWVAYTAADGSTTRTEVFVRPFPNSDAGAWQVSNGGGGSPTWSPDGKELLFISPVGRLVAAAIAPGPAFHVSSLTTLGDATPFNYNGFHPASQMTSAGELVMLTPVASLSSSADRLVRVTNWFAEVAAKLKR